MADANGWTYKDAGVDIDAGNRAVELMKGAVRATYRPGVMGDIGGFGGLFALDTAKYSHPVLVSGTDGVGTKLKIAFMMDKHDTIGQDAVAMCVNDILVQGAEPLFFLDYLAVGKLVPEQVATIVRGVAEGCRLAGCALIGGETAEMAGFYPPGEYDIAGFAVGVADKEQIITGEHIRPGDQLLGLASSGLHSNGYSLVRKICFDVMGFAVDRFIPELGQPLGEALLTPTRIYVGGVLPAIRRYPVKGLAHITGGGLIDNIPRILPAGVTAYLDPLSWPAPPVFTLLAEWGRIPREEMYRTFNMGIGMVLAVAPEDVAAVTAALTAGGETVYAIGEIRAGDGGVRLG